jgi:CHASE3 domain sensor protein
MRSRASVLVSSAVLLAASGCGSDDSARNDQATTTTPGGAEVTTTDERSRTTETGGRGGRLSAEGRAVLDATQDLAVDVSETADEFARGRIDEDEAMARLELAGERADDLRRRAQELPAADRARERLASLNAEVTRTATELSQVVSSGRAADRGEIDERIAHLRREVRSTVDAVSEQLDERTQRRLREALDRIGAETPG